MDICRNLPTPQDKGIFMTIQVDPAFHSFKNQIQQVCLEPPADALQIYNGKRNLLYQTQIGSHRVVVKRFGIPNMINRYVYGRFRESKAKRSYIHAQKLLKSGIGTPAPVAYLETRRGFALNYSYYVCEMVDASLTYRDLVKNQGSVNEWETVLRAFTRFTYQMHEAGILFKDHSPGNTLIDPDGKDSQFYLVDLNRMTFKQLSFQERIDNFSRLTPREDMVKIMADEYAKLIGNDSDAIFTSMWSATEKFQSKFRRKRKLKRAVKGSRQKK